MSAQRLSARRGTRESIAALCEKALYTQSEKSPKQPAIRDGIVKLSGPLCYIPDAHMYRCWRPLCNGSATLTYMIESAVLFHWVVRLN
jgi:hypothetical protein